MTSQPNDPFSAPGASGVPGELAQLRGRVGELSQTMFAARGSGELMDTVAEIETLKSTLDALELAVVRELEATGAVKPVGWASTQDFLTSVAGGTKATDRRWSGSRKQSRSRSWSWSVTRWQRGGSPLSRHT